MNNQNLVNEIIEKEIELYGTKRKGAELKVLELSSEPVLIKLAEYLDNKLKENKRIPEGTQFIILNGDYQLVTVSGIINTQKGVFYTVLENSEIFTKEDIINQLSRHDVLLAKLEKQEERRIQATLEKNSEAEKEKERLKDYNFCYGYTDTKTALQGGRILKALNKQILYNNSLITRKNLIHSLISNNSKTEIHTDKEGKKTNRFYTATGSFFEVTKIEYDYINYLLNEKCIINIDLK